MSNPVSAGQALAARHRRRAEPDSTSSVLNYAESPRLNDWTLRSALVRLAQPEPTRAGAVLELVRRCDAALHPMIRSFEAETVLCDRHLTMDSLTDEDPAESASGDAGAGGDGDAGTPGRYPDARVVDLARLALDMPDEIGAVVDTYGEETELSEEERLALPLVEVALKLDALGDLLADWAGGVGGQPAPLEQLDRICADTFARLEDIGVPREQGPPRGRGRG